MHFHASISAGQPALAGYNQKVALTSRFAGKQPSTRRRAIPRWPWLCGSRFQIELLEFPRCRTEVAELVNSRACGW